MSELVPFRIGDVKWMPGHTPEKLRVPCPVCNGDLAVTVILGTGEHVGVPCEACVEGFDGPRGYIEEWSYKPRAVRFEISSIASMHRGRWWVNSTTGEHAEYTDLRDTEAEALAVSRERCAKQHEANMADRAHHRKNTAKHTWSIKYHRKKIADYERRIKWHKSKIEARRSKQPTTPQPGTTNKEG